MDKILLIISENGLRQLYHRLLVIKKLEVVAVEGVAHAFLMLGIEAFNLVVIYTDDLLTSEVEAFLKVRAQRKPWAKTPVLLLTSSVGSYHPWLGGDDLVIDPSEMAIDQIVERIATRKLRSRL